MASPPLLTVTNLTKRFPANRGWFPRSDRWLRVVNGVSLDIRRGESLGLVGESGCGKSTLARLITRLQSPSGGTIAFDGMDITTLGRRAMQPLRRRMQIIFQDPYASLDPRMTVAAIVTEPLMNGKRPAASECRHIAADLLATVGLRSEDLDKYPHAFSGGQRQRIGIARALCVKPELIIADEPVSALDVSIQAQILNLMMRLKKRFGLAYLFISHDIGVVAHFCDRIAVMYAGHIVEIVPAAAFDRYCRHPYTQALVNAVPRPDPGDPLPPATGRGEPPDPMDLPPGCPYHPRCPHAMADCPVRIPPLEPLNTNHQVACWLGHEKRKLISIGY
ncbi:MAG: peptide ABC transporter substrate-binding protein [Deltaproteobacteria bacterium]|nr:MAG: peptide ABC transporter substrate-binding protein [Deltaproteobacteria bacterium]